MEEIGEEMTSEALERARGPRASRRRWRSSPSVRPRRCAGWAIEHDARMIVVGTQGESPLRSAILGSIPHKLLQVAERPVLVVPPDDDS